MEPQEQQAVVGAGRLWLGAHSAHGAADDADHGLSTGIPHAAHTHAETDSDSHTCKIRKRGRVCSDARRNHPRAWVRDEGTYSCREPDDDLLLALGCAW